MRPISSEPKVFTNTQGQFNHTHTHTQSHTQILASLVSGKGNQVQHRLSTQSIDLTGSCSRQLAPTQHMQLSR